MENKILVAYASRAGSTAEVAETVGEVLRKSGAAVEVRRVQEVQDISPYHAIVLGSAVHAMRLLPEAVQFANKFAGALRAKPTAYFICCLAMKEADKPENVKVAEGYLKPLRQVKEPVSMGLFAGKMDYSKLGAITRFIIKAMKITEGDFRNWDAIKAWAEQLWPLLVA
jgi:menaquinone-dependent protoporphyrinogen oxidase